MPTYAGLQLEDTCSQVPSLLWIMLNLMKWLNAMYSMNLYMGVEPRIVGKPPKSSHFNRVFHYKPSILGYPYFWKHPYVCDCLRISVYMYSYNYRVLGLTIFIPGPMGTKPIEKLWRRRVGSLYISHICDLHDFCLPYTMCLWMTQDDMELLHVFDCVCCWWHNDTCALHATMKVKYVTCSHFIVSQVWCSLGSISANGPNHQHTTGSKQQETTPCNSSLQFNNDSKNFQKIRQTQQTQQIELLWFLSQKVLPFPADMFWLFSKPQVQVLRETGKRCGFRGCLLKDSGFAADILHSTWFDMHYTHAYLNA